MRQLPRSIKELIQTNRYQIDEIGQSGSTVILFEKQVLKIQPVGDETKNEYQVMQWLEGKLPVPKIIAVDCLGEKNYLLMSKVKGKMACDATFMNEPKYLTRLLANALKQFWAIDTSDFPTTMKIEKKLEIAKSDVENGRVDMSHVQPETFGVDGFKNPKELLLWLIANKPEEEMVFSHGDLSLPNVFFC